MDNKINKIILFLGILLLILGQFFLLYYKQIYIFISLTAISILLFLYYYLKNYLMLPINFLLLIILTFLTIAGYVNLNKNTLPFIFFLISAIILFLITIITRDFFKITDINFNKEKIHKWEILYILFIVIISYFLYFFKLNEIPPGAVYHEGVMASHFPALERPNYMPYMPDDQANWSTFVFYLGLFFTKIFGYNIVSVRIPSAIFALLSVIAFYFLLRRLTSSFTAAMITPLFMANECFISLSRQFYPVTVLYIAPLLGLYFIIEGVYKNKWYYYLFSGFAVGFSLHGYLAGRPIILVFIIWLFFLSFIYKNKFILFNLLFFILGFIITSLPVIYTAIFHPKIFWHYVHFVDPQKGADVVTRLKQFLDAIIPHIRLFYTGGDIESLLKPAGDPFFSREPFAMILFTVGFIFCCIAFFRPVPLLLFLLLLFSFIPSFFSGTTMLKRSSMAIPAIFLIAGFVFEVIRYTVKSYNLKKTNVFLTVILSLIIILSIYNSVNGYFKIIINDPGIKLTFNYPFFKISEIIKQNKTKIIYINPLKTTLGINVGPTILFPKDITIRYFKFNHEIIYSKYNDILFVLEPFMESAMDIFKKIYPSCNVYISKEEKINAKFYKSGLSPWEKHYDHYNPFCYALAIEIKTEDIKKLQSSLVDKSLGNERLIDIIDNNFSEKYKNQKLDLYGMFLVDSWQNKKEIKIIMDWNKWEIKIDGKKLNNNSKIILDGGVHFLNIKGIVPDNYNGKLPLKILDGTINLIENNFLVAMSEPYGVKTTYFEGENGWKNGKEKFIFYEFLYLKRYFDFPMSSFPFSVVFEGKIKPDISSEYYFSNDGNMRCQIYIDKKLVYDNINTNSPFNPIQQSIKLEADKKYDIKIFQNFYYTRPNFNTMIIYYKKNINDDIVAVPASWITIY